MFLVSFFYLKIIIENSETKTRDFQQVATQR